MNDNDFDPVDFFEQQLKNNEKLVEEKHKIIRLMKRTNIPLGYYIVLSIRLDGSSMIITEDNQKAEDYMQLLPMELRHEENRLYVKEKFGLKHISSVFKC